MRTRNKDPLLWAARHLSIVLAQRARDRERGEHFDTAVLSLLHHQLSLARHWSRSCKASLHGWSMAAAAERRLLGELAQTAEYYVAQVVNHRPERTSSSPIGLRTLVDELRQLDEEFEDLQIVPRQRVISAVTEPITLEEIRLGRFQIELHLDRLSRSADVTAFDCVALDPNPASMSESTTHPHVRDHGLCAGEATVPIASALRQGRICDAFLLISGVLQTYNSGSPYISLNEWHGIACADCGFTQDEDQLYRCHHCDDRICGSCISSCDACNDEHCSNCLDREHGEGELLCPTCRATCPRCQQVCAAGDIEEHGLCNYCQEEDQEQELTPPPTQEEADHERETSDNTITASNTTVEAEASVVPAA